MDVTRFLFKSAGILCNNGLELNFDRVAVGEKLVWISGICGDLHWARCATSVAAVALAVESLFEPRPYHVFQVSIGDPVVLLEGPVARISGQPLPWKMLQAYARRVRVQFFLGSFCQLGWNLWPMLPWGE